MNGNNATSAHSIPAIAEVLGAHSPNTAPSQRAAKKAAVAMVLREDEKGKVESLFIRRAEHPTDPWSGQMAFPGGRVDPGDATEEAAAVRETAEEVGMELFPEMRLGRLHDVDGGRVNRALSVSAFVFHHPEPPALRLNGEVADVVWVPLDYLGNAGNVRPYIFPLDPVKREFCSLQYRGYTIWGLTYRIVVNYFRLFGVELPVEKGIANAE